MKVLKMVGFKNIDIQTRDATVGAEDLRNFYQKEGIRMSKVTLKQGKGNQFLTIGFFGSACRA